MYRDEFHDYDRDEFRKPRYISCRDGYCGAEDCPKCRPGNFREGVYIGDIEEE